MANSIIILLILLYVKSFFQLMGLGIQTHVCSMGKLKQSVLAPLLFMIIMLFIDISSYYILAIIFMLCSSTNPYS